MPQDAGEGRPPGARLLRRDSSSFLSLRGQIWIAPILFSLVLVATAPVNFLLFHVLGEFFAMAVAVTVFAVAWNTYPFTRSSFLLYLGCGYLWIAALDLIHTLAYQGMGVFPTQSANMATQFWIAGRFFEAVVMLTAPLMLQRPVDPRKVLAGGGGAFVLLCLTIYAGLIPAAYVEGEGLTPFKVGAEYAVILILVAAGLLLWRRRERMDASLNRWVMFAVGLTIVAELAFTLYFEIVSVAMAVGHLFKFWSYWFVYIALVRFTLRNPFRIIGRETGVYDAFREPTAIVDREGFVRQVNSALRQTHGPDLIGQECHARLHPRDLPRRDCAVCKAITDASSVEATELFFPEREQWQEITLTPFLWAGRVVGMVHVARDVTERHRAAEALARDRDQARSYLEVAEVILIALDAMGHIISFNRKAAAVTGWSEKEVLGRNWFDFLPEEARSSARATFGALLEGDMQRGEFNENEILTRSGQRRLIAWHNAPLLDSRGRVIGALSSGEDVTEQRHDELRLRQAAAVYETSPEGVIISDAARRIVAVNPAFLRITGFAEEEVVDKALDETDAPLGDALFHEVLWRQLEASGSWQGESRKVRKSGESFPVWEHISALRDAEGNVTYYITVFTDISPLKASEERLGRLAHHDPLTGKPNRLLFTSRLGHALERATREGNRLAVLFVDLDRFKKVNDTFGHAIGDQLLVEAAARLERCVRAEDTVARIGGDEFTLLLEPLQHAADAGKVAQKIVEVLHEPFHLEGHEVTVGASVGVSIYPEHGTEIDLLLDHADVAMYRAKECGRNNYQFYTEDLTTSAHERLDLERRLRGALERHELVVHYQPQAEVESGRVVGVEALVRWRHPEWGLLLPERFLALAEESGFIDAIDEWVMRTACAQMAQWREEGLPVLHVAVNLSGRLLARGGWVEKVQRVLDETHIEAPCLELEIAESWLTENGGPATANLKALKRLGVTLVIERFGAGHSSLHDLKSLAVDKLKIDRSFVERALHDEDAAVVARAIIALGHTMRLTVAAQGVSSASQLAFLRGAGPDGHALTRHDEYQGFLCQYALPADELANWMRAGAGRADFSCH